MVYTSNHYDKVPNDASRMFLMRCADVNANVWKDEEGSHMFEVMNWAACNNLKMEIASRSMGASRGWQGVT